MSKKKKKIYIVLKGHQSGIFHNWLGADGAEAQIRGYPSAQFKGFHSADEAMAWVHQHAGGKKAELLLELQKISGSSGNSHSGISPSNHADGDTVIIFTDGSAIGNPGPGGYGVVLKYRKYRRELSGGFHHKLKLRQSDDPRKIRVSGNHPKRL